jgi:hypothetical protein
VTTPQNGLLFHFTHIENLPSIIANGLRSDLVVRVADALEVEVGEDRIKEARRSRPVPVPPGGVVADYVPFYFAARSPMLYTIHCGNVVSYQGGQDSIVYLVSEISMVLNGGCSAVFTDRNAYYPYAMFEADALRAYDEVDWPLMRAHMWKNTGSEPDRMERRMAEMLVHDAVPFRLIGAIAARSEATLVRVSDLLASVEHQPKLAVRTDWYF